MNDEGTSEQRQAKRRDAPVRARSRSLKGGLDPAELGRRSGRVRRERAAAAERDAELNRLTVQARLATAIAAKLTYADLAELIAGLVERAKGNGHVANGAAAQLLAMARVASGDEGDADTEGMDYADMTPAQRAARRAELQRALEEWRASEGAPPAADGE